MWKEQTCSSGLWSCILTAEDNVIVILCESSKCILCSYLSYVYTTIFGLTWWFCWSQTLAVFGTQPRECDVCPIIRSWFSHTGWPWSPLGPKKTSLIGIWCNSASTVGLATPLDNWCGECQTGSRISPVRLRGQVYYEIRVKSVVLHFTVLFILNFLNKML